MRSMMYSVVVILALVTTFSNVTHAEETQAGDAAALQMETPKAPEAVKAAPKTAATAEFKPGKGLDIRSTDGDFRLKLKLFGHLLYTATGGDGPTAKGKTRGTDDWMQSMTMRRIWLYMSGNVFGKHNKYKLQLGFSPKDMGYKDGAPTKGPVMDYYFTFDYLRDFTVQVGQYRIPFNKQRIMGYGNLQFVDRSIGNFEFTLDRDMGLEFRSDDLGGWEKLRYRAGVFLGEGLESYEESDFGLLYLARVEYLPLGFYKDYVEGDIKRMETPGLSFGLAYAFIDDAKNDKGVKGSAPDDGGTTDFHALTADVNFKYKGFSLNGEFYYRNGTRDYGSVQAEDDNGNLLFETDGVTPLVDREDPRDGYGWYTQLGYVIPWAPVEFTGRYGQVRGMGDSTLGDLDEIGFGVNWYIHGTGLALKADYNHYYRDNDMGDATDQVRMSLQATL